MGYSEATYGALNCQGIAELPGDRNVLVERGVCVAASGDDDARLAGSDSPQSALFWVEKVIGSNGTAIYMLFGEEEGEILR
ncbi:hypothetical protein V7S43_010587 [Phytophthora oleae]|uniref:Uncharacterized protein n=1 Tax=Phytophthora oleae TaxID=2107226 RepID=A0ABD3FBI3_9STRA